MSYKSTYSNCRKSLRVNPTSITSSYTSFKSIGSITYIRVIYSSNILQDERSLRKICSAWPIPPTPATSTATSTNNTAATAPTTTLAPKKKTVSIKTNSVNRLRSPCQQSYPADRSSSPASHSIKSRQSSAPYVATRLQYLTVVSGWASSYTPWQSPEPLVMLVTAVLTS